MSQPKARRKQNAIRGLLVLTGLTIVGCYEMPNQTMGGPTAPTFRSSAGAMDAVEQLLVNFPELRLPQPALRGPTAASRRIAERLAQPGRKANIAQLRARNKMSWYGEAYISRVVGNTLKPSEHGRGKFDGFCSKLYQAVPKVDPRSGTAIRDSVTRNPTFVALCGNVPAMTSQVSWTRTAAELAANEDSVTITVEGMDLVYAAESQLMAAADSADLINRLSAILDEVDQLGEGDQMIVGAAVSVALEGYVTAYDDANWPPPHGGDGDGNASCLGDALNNGLSPREAFDECNGEIFPTEGASLRQERHLTSPVFISAVNVPGAMWGECNVGGIPVEGASPHNGQRRSSPVFMSAVNAPSAMMGVCDTVVRPALKKYVSHIFMGGFMAGFGGGVVMGVIGKVALTTVLVGSVTAGMVVGAAAVVGAAYYYSQCD